MPLRELRERTQELRAALDLPENAALSLPARLRRWSRRGCSEGSASASKATGLVAIPVRSKRARPSGLHGLGSGLTFLRSLRRGKNCTTVAPAKTGHAERFTQSSVMYSGLDTERVISGHAPQLLVVGGAIVPIVRPAHSQ